MNRLALCIPIVLMAFVALGQKSNDRDANQHFKTGNYPVALKMYNDLYKADTTNTENAYRLGVCYLNTTQNPAMALEYLLKAKSKYSADMLFNYELGKAYLFNADFKNALETFQAACQLSAKNKEFNDMCQVSVKMAENAQRLYASPLNVTFINLGKGINSAMDETTPMISPDGEMLFYTSNNKYDPKFFYYTSDIYMSAASDGEFEKGKQAGSINSPDDELLAGLSMGGERLYFQMIGYEAYQDLVVSTISNKNVQGKVLLSASVNSKELENGACESVNGDTLYFASAGHGSMGGLDLFYCLKLPTGDWSAPRNLGPTINTIYDEDYPVLSDNGSKLMFASNGPASMGGYDIFTSTIDADSRQFETPKNIGYPLNDVFDNQSIAYSPNKRYAYVSAVKPDGIGGKDLYRVVFNNEDPSVKIMVLKFLTGTTEANKPLAAADTTLKVIAYQKGKMVFGQYAYDKNSSQVTIALLPGQYTIEISGDAIKSEELKITIADKPGSQKIEKRNVFVQFK